MYLMHTRASKGYFLLSYTYQILNRNILQYTKNILQIFTQMIFIDPIVVLINYNL